MTGAANPPREERHLDDRKQPIRERIWKLLEDRRAAAFPGAWGRIPNFVGASKAADRLATLEEWRAARAIKSNPPPSTRCRSFAARCRRPVTTSASI